MGDDAPVSRMRWSDPVPQPRRLPADAEFPLTPGWPVTLRHRELVLRPLLRGDRDQWDAVRRENREWLRPWDSTLPQGATPGASGFRALRRGLDAQARAGLALPWALCVDPDPRLRTPPVRCPVVGQVTVGNIVYGAARWAHIGYWIDHRLAGRGLMPRAVALAIDHCFQQLGLHRIEINIRPENASSLRVVEKLGLRHEGRRPAYLHIDGAWRDHESFAIHADEVPEGMTNRLLTAGADRAGGIVGG